MTNGEGGQGQPLPAVHLSPDDGLQSYTEPYPRPGANRGSFIPGRSVVHVVATQGDWAQVSSDGVVAGWVAGARLVPPIGQHQQPSSYNLASPSRAPAPSYVGGYTPGGNGMAVTALVLGIVGIVFSFFFLFLGLLALILGLLAIVFGWVGLQRSRNSGVGRGQAIAGLVLGIITIIVSVYMIWVIDSFFSSVSDAIDRSTKPSVAADPVTNRMTLAQCNTTIGRSEASGTLVNTGSETRNFSVTVTFYGPGGKADSVGSAYGVEPGATESWFVQGPNVTQLSGCSFGRSISTSATPPSTLVAGPPR